MNVILETERLVLRELTLQDCSFIVQLLNTPGWLKYIGDRGVRTEEDAQKYLENGPFKSYAVNGFGLWLVALKDSDQPIGMCGLIKRDFLENVDIGFAFLPEFASKGYGFEAATVVKDYAFDTLKLPKLAGITSLDNEISIRLLEKIGLKYEKTIKYDGSEEEVMLFVVSATLNYRCLGYAQRPSSYCSWR